MRIPYTINKNTIKTYSFYVKPSVNNHLISHDFEWDKTVPKLLREQCVEKIAECWAENPIIKELCLPIDRCLLVDILPIELPLQLTVPQIDDDVYWKRCYESRWPKNPPLIAPDEDFSTSIVKIGSSNSSNHSNVSKTSSRKSSTTSGLDGEKLTWKRCFLETHLQEDLENLDPEDYDPEKIKDLADLCGAYVKNLELRQLRAPQKVSDRIPLTAILTGLPKLEKLTICFKQTYVGDNFSWHVLHTSLNDIKSLSKGLEKHYLTTLKIHNSDVDCNKVLIILKSLLKNSSLKTLDFSHCKISDRGVLGFTKLLLEIPTLETIILTNNKIGPKGAMALACVLARPTCNLRTLDLRLNFVGFEGGKCLMEALIKGGKSMQNLHMAACRMKQNPFIASMIYKNNTLLCLDISNNKLGEEIGREILRALDKNVTLTKFDVRMCVVTPEVECEIAKKIERNRVLQKKRKYTVGSQIVEDRFDCDGYNQSMEVMREIEDAFSSV